MPNYLHRKDSKKLIKLRQEYLLYVYKRHLDNILLMVQKDKKEKINQALAYVGKNPKCLDEFISSRNFNRDNMEIMKTWKNEKYGKYHIVGMRDEGVELYDPLKECVYLVKIVEKEDVPRLTSLSMNINVCTSVYEFNGTYVADYAIVLEEEMKLLANLEQIYEKSLSIKHEKGIYINEREVIITELPNRSSTENMPAVLLDFFRPFFDLNIEYDVTFFLNIIQESWNKALLPDTKTTTNEIGACLVDRKNKYFSAIRNPIISIDVYPEGETDAMEIKLGEAI